MMSFRKIALGALLAMPLVMQPAFAQQRTDVNGRMQEEGVSRTDQSAPANAAPVTRTGDGQVVNRDSNSVGGEGSGGGAKK